MHYGHGRLHGVDLWHGYTVIAGVVGVRLVAQTSYSVVQALVTNVRNIQYTQIHRPHQGFGVVRSLLEKVFNSRGSRNIDAVIRLSE